MANRGKFYEATEKYVNEVVALYLKAIDNVESVQCKHMGVAGDAFIELVHEDGYTRYFDVTELTISQIGILIGCIVANKPVKCEVRDHAAKKEIRKLFR